MSDHPAFRQETTVNHHQRPKPKLCLRDDCADHDHDHTWTRPAPSTRPAYAAARLLPRGLRAA